MGEDLIGGSADLHALDGSLRAHLAARFRQSHWLLSFVLGSFFIASCGNAGDPSAADLSRVEITLQRSACYGACPNYKVTIHGDGQVVFTTDTAPAVPKFVIAQFVLLPGTHEDRIASGTVAALFALFQKAGFFDLRDSYRAEVTDSPTYVLTVDLGRRHKWVEDYVGRVVGMPKVVTELEDAVDKAAGTDRWVRGSGLIAWPEGQHFDFHSRQATQIAVSGAYQKADEGTMLALIDHGAPLDGEVSNPRFRADLAPDDGTIAKLLERFPEYKKPVVAGFSLMDSAIQHRQVRLFNKLVAVGWLDRLGKAQVAQLFAQYAAGCWPAMVDATADAGIDIDEPESPEGRTALANLGTSHRCGSREAERVATARRLLERGANPNRRDGLGHTALYGVVNLDMVNLLLAHGAERR